MNQYLELYQDILDLEERQRDIRQRMFEMRHEFKQLENSHELCCVCCGMHIHVKEGYGIRISGTSAICPGKDK